jgi:hypothetical protein
MALPSPYQGEGMHHSFSYQSAGILSESRLKEAFARLDEIVAKISRSGAPQGLVANFSRPVCELGERAARPNFWLWIEVSDDRISTYGRIDGGSAERNSLTNRARKNFATGPVMSELSLSSRTARRIARTWLACHD